MNNFSNILMKITEQVTETKDEFIFKTISNWLQDTQQIIISKKELVDAITFYRKAKKENLEEIRVNCTIPSRYVEQLSFDFGSDEVLEYATSKLMNELAPYVKKNLTRHDDIMDSIVYSFDAYIRRKENPSDRAETTDTSDR